MLTFNKQQVVEKAKTITTETKREINVSLLKHQTTYLSKSRKGSNGQE